MRFMRPHGHTKGQFHAVQCGSCGSAVAALFSLFLLRGSQAKAVVNTLLGVRLMGSGLLQELKSLHTSENLFNLVVRYAGAEIPPTILVTPILEYQAKHRDFDTALRVYDKPLLRK